MEFDNAFFIKYLRNIKSNKDEFSYIYRLYKSFNLMRQNLTGNLQVIKRKLDKYEDDIYLINGSVLDQKERLLVELDRIIRKLKDNDISNVDELYKNVQKLKRILSIKGLTDAKILLSLKKEVSLIQAKLDLPNTFLYATYLVFMEIYNNAYINSLTKSGYTKEEEVNKK